MKVYLFLHKNVGQVNKNKKMTFEIENIFFYFDYWIFCFIINIHKYYMYQCQFIFVKNI